MCWIALAGAGLTAGCDGCSSFGQPIRPVQELRRSEAKGGEDLREALRPRYTRAMARARAWLDALHVNPAELREVGIKGKKKLTEQIDAYYRLWRVAGSKDKPALLQRVKEVAAVTYEDHYHDMPSIPDRWFKQDATSYLRTALLMERMGLDTTRYRREIKKAHQRLNGHMHRRGPHQRRIFHWYYKHFGLSEPFPLADALKGGFIAKRLPPDKLDRNAVYDLTHEVYALYQYGDRLDVDPFDVASKRYLRGALATLVAKYISQDNPDLTGELVECLHFLRMSGEKAYRNGVLFLLDSQNPDGSWGVWERQRRRLGGYVKHGFMLHTTLVAIGALTAVFDHPMPPPAR